MESLKTNRGLIYTEVTIYLRDGRKFNDSWGLSQKQIDSGLLIYNARRISDEGWTCYAGCNDHFSLACKENSSPKIRSYFPGHEIVQVSWEQ